jgi:two-component system C4-dicarboxylate transport sensor histidine kinase DctB
MASAKQSTAAKWVYPAALLVILTASLSWSYRAIGLQALEDLADQSQNRLTLFVSNLNAALDKFEHLPKLISTNYRLVKLVQQAGSADIKDTNRYLKTVAETSGASDVYLMGSDGTTLASSNWDLSHSFIGMNFNFRPYFQQALSGKTGRYFALGTTSHERGYYFSYPVYQAKSVVGAVVVKINLADIETAWASQGNHFVVTDDDGIVFLSTQPEWTYRSLQPIDEARIAQIQQSRRYLGKSISLLQLNQLDEVEPGITRVSLGSSAKAPASQFLHLSQNIADAGWTVHLFANVAPLKDIQILRTSLAGFAMLILLLLVVLYLTNRQRRLALQGSTELLEKRVQQRTLELQNEVEERKKAERSLLDTQAELIQAAKLAGLGQMSAGISHELNQPLTAIRNYAKNAQRFLERNQLDAANSNLEEINEITEGMAGIISQLRGFSRKSSGERSQVSVAQAVSQALGMFQHDIESRRVRVVADINPELSVLTDPLLLNQVLVNVISNAIQAMSEVAQPCIDIEVTSTAGEIILQISDIGPGIPENVIENIFDPFFTTKEVGLGLGLGLSISYRIMESLGGRIEVTNISAGGASFRLYLADE